jgi:NitT/TauT family transport system permease protein
MARERLSDGRSDGELFRYFSDRETRAEAVRRQRRSVINAAGRLLVLALLVGGWGVASTVYPPMLVPSPRATWQAFVDGLDTIWQNAPPTLVEIALGFLAGSALGIGLGALIAQSRWMEVVVRPYLVVAQAVPKIALAPVLIIVLGYGIGSKVAIAALIAFFPLLENTITGLQRVDPDSLRLFRSLGASPGQIFVKLRLFSALPMIFAGLRIAAVLATLGAIVGEFVAGDRGLGALLVISMGTFSTPLMYATMAVLTLLAGAVYAMAQWLERTALRRYNLTAPGE